MKNMKKFITLCGFLILGSIACGDADVVKAEAINEQTTDTSGYTITIPSEVCIDKASGKGSFAVTGKIDAQTELDVSVSSQNGYKLKNKNQEISYSLDKDSFYINNIKSADMKSFDENFNITLANTNTSFSGSYEDRLTFNIESLKYTYELDLNSILDGVNNYSVHDYGTVDIYINGVKVADDVSDWKSEVHYGDSYEIKDIKGTTGHHYSGVVDGWNNLNGFPLKGNIGIDTKHIENKKGNLYSCIVLKFDTNTYTVKYDSNGGTGSMEDTIHKYFKRDDMDGVTKLRKNTFTKIGYNFKGWYMTRTINGETYYLYDNWQWYKEGTEPSATKKYLYTDEKTSSNATTINRAVLTAVAQWEKYANQYVARFHSNGGQLNIIDDSITKLGNDTNNGFVDVVYRLNTSWYWKLGIQANKTGYRCIGYYDAPEGGTKVFDYKYLDEIKDNAGVAIPNSKYFDENYRWIYENDLELYPHWKATAPNYDSGTVLNIEGSDYIVMDRTEDGNYKLISGTNIGNMQYQPNQDSNGNYYDIGKYNENDLPETRYDGQNSNVYEDSYIDKYLESTYYKSLPEKLKKAIVATQIKQTSYTNTGMNNKWRLLSKDTNPVSPDGTSNWFYNEGTSENPKYIRYDKVTTPDGEGGVYPLKYWTKAEKGYGGQSYNTITRHVYLPSVEEISNLVDLNDANKTYAFLKGTNNSLNHMWLRDASSISSRDAMILYYDHLSLGNNFVTDPWFGVRPAFVIDLSKINATVVDTVKYK